MPFYPTGNSVVTIETDFVEKGEVMLRTAQQTTRIFERHLAALEGELEPIIVPVFRDYTPIGLDSWHHQGGALYESTSLIVGKGDQAMSAAADVTGTLRGVTEQFVIQIEQPATNAYGVEYAPFVIEGHRTRSSVGNEPGRYSALRDALRSTGPGWVPANPYPERAMMTLLPLINERLAVRCRMIADETVQYMAYAGGS